MIKNMTSVGTYQWEIFDTARIPNNSTVYRLYANLSNGEDSVVGGAYIDILSNGFKIRSANGSNINTDGINHIYAAFAETPFKYANAR